jgi:proteasome assembly chaperone (PAC2) family protein
MVVDQQLVHWSTDQQVRLAVGTAVVALWQVITLGTLVVPVAEEKPMVVGPTKPQVLELLGKATLGDLAVHPVAVAAAGVLVELVRLEQVLVAALVGLEVRLL